MLLTFLARLPFLLAGTLLALPSFAATLAVLARTADGKALRGAIVAVRNVDGPNPPQAPVRAVMDQVHRTFQPDLLVIPIGSTVEFPNTDSVSHQIYSFSPAKKFQLPLYRGKPYPPVHFDQAGIVTLGCNIHDSMLAFVVVTDAAYFGQVDSSGAWSVELPRGTYNVSIWHPRLPERLKIEQDVVVGEGDRAAVTLRATKPLVPAPLEAGQHSWSTY